MAKKDDGSVFGGFDAVFDSISSPQSVGDGKSKYPLQDVPVYEGEEEDAEQDDQEEEINEDEEVDKDKTEEIEEESEEEESEEEEEEVDEDVSTEDEEQEEEEQDDETTIVSPFVDLFSKELGWELEEEDRPKSISELVDYMSEIIEANSKPKYHSEDIAALDEFVKEGGDIKEYFSVKYGETDLSKLDISKEDNQKLVVRELLKRKGFSEEKIDRKINTYEDAGVLEEESEDAIEILKEENEKASDKLLEEQKKLNEEYLKKQQKFVTDVKGLVDETNNIRGIPISKNDKDMLKDYIFKVDKDGKTKYQKDYGNDFKNLIESAYFTMKGDLLVKNIKNKAQSDAVIEFKKKLKSKQRVNKSDNTRDIGSSKESIIGTISRALINPIN